jgi:HSP20 family molecular chaperone IbpA
MGRADAVFRVRSVPVSLLIEEEDRTMDRTSAFRNPLLLGFERLERVLASASRASAEGYPPYNIEQIGDDQLRLTLAVAGFAIDDLSIALEENQLVIKGRKKEDESGRVFLHRGIAARQFQRAWVLAEGWEVGAATLDNGLLHIGLRRVDPDPTVRSVQITRGSASGGHSAD